ncbi:hypothetical protein KO561_02630 [Radiobacillus kanasensis]|uniref:hypothetical protein n=1 Tax=Radiobacillus kanasensis TaxID=2844358 RepID=UPI001E41419D|nr:hypothetical protein [Radiobacillus kanasensis]UFT99876.1 hypothetical protein KO561_02630 [Radiobacillus kanasensis]
MKLSLIVHIIGKTIDEIKECAQMSKNVATKTEKRKYLTLLLMNILILPVYLIPIIYSLVII